MKPLAYIIKKELPRNKFPGYSFSLIFASLSFEKGKLVFKEFISM